MGQHSIAACDVLLLLLPVVSFPGLRGESRGDMPSRNQCCFERRADKLNGGGGMGGNGRWQGEVDKLDRETPSMNHLAAIVLQCCCSLSTGRHCMAVTTRSLQ
jgi:hypothetical protein